MKQIFKDETAENIFIFEADNGYLVRLSAPRIGALEEKTRQRLIRINRIVGGAIFLVVAVLLAINYFDFSGWFFIIVIISGVSLFLAFNFALSLFAEFTYRTGFDFDFSFDKDNQTVTYLGDKSLWHVAYRGNPFFEFKLFEPFVGLAMAKIDQNSAFVVAEVSPHTPSQYKSFHLEFRGGLNQSKIISVLNAYCLGFGVHGLSSIAATLNQAVSLTRNSQNQGSSNIERQGSTSANFNPMD